MTTIVEVIDKLTAVQAGLAIEEPTAMKVQAVYPSIPTGKGAAPTPFWLTTWTLRGVAWRPNARREHAYEIHSQLAVHDLQPAQALAIARAFLPVYLDALSGSVMLDLPGVVLTAVRGGEPTEASFTDLKDAQGKPLHGLDLYHDVTIYDVDVARGA